MSKYRVIGQRVPKVDGYERVTGKAAYGADIHPPGMLYGRVLRSPYPHARIKSIDVSRAEVLDGVKAVITGDDFPTIKPGAHLQDGAVPRDLYGVAITVMAREKALFVGHAVAAVAATSPQVAEDALDLIRVEYEPLEPVEDAESAMRPDAPVIHSHLFTMSLGERATTPSNVAERIELGWGDVEKGFAEADAVVEGTYRTRMVHQGYIEPDAATVWIDPDGMVNIWSSSQSQFGVRNQVSAILGIPQNKIRAIAAEIGGGFGGKLQVRLEPLCVLLVRKARRPVRMSMTRAEVLQATGPGAPSVAHVKLGATKDGRLTAARVTFIMDAGCFPGSPVAAAASGGLAPYRLPHMKVEGFDVVTNKPKVQAYRAPGSTQAAFAIEQGMDALAEKLGIDPLQLRIKNATEEGDRLPNGQPLPRVGYKQILEQVSKHPAWTTPLKGPNRGRGLAVSYWRGATFTSACHVILNKDATLELVAGAVDLTGTRTTMAQVAAEEIGLSMDEVHSTVGDTSNSGFSDASDGSRIAYTMSTAVHAACQDIIAQLKQRAAEKLKVDAKLIDYANKVFVVKDVPEKRVTLAELAEASYAGRGTIIGKGVAAGMKFAPAFGAHVADVEIDTETGKAKVLRYTAFHEVGCALNPNQVEGQIQGGAVQGIGWGFFEEYVFDKGVMKNPTLLDYRLPTALDVPLIETDIIEVPAPEGPYGVRGVGEIPIGPPPAALANAVYRAIGIRLTELPMNPERVFWAIKSRARARESSSVSAPAA